MNETTVEEQNKARIRTMDLQILILQNLDKLDERERAVLFDTIELVNSPLVYIDPYTIEKKMEKEAKEAMGKILNKDFEKNIGKAMGKNIEKEIVKIFNEDFKLCTETTEKESITNIVKEEFKW